MYLHPPLGHPAPTSTTAAVVAGHALLLGLACAPVTAPAQDGAVQPNIVVLFADDLGYGELGCQGNPEIPTPHIDSLAAGGVRFTDGYVTAPYCSASRAGLMTGRVQNRFGYEFNPTGAHNADPAVGLPEAERTLAEILRDDAGYATALVGKWHLGGTARFHPLRHGFGSFFGFLHEGHYFVPPPYEGVVTMLRRRALPGGGKGRWISPDGRLVLSTHMGHNEPAYDADNPVLRDSQPVEERAHLTDAFTREATGFIRRNRGRPFLLYLAYGAVHSPLQGADAHLERNAGIADIHRRIFAAMLTHLDDSVGAVLGALREAGVEGRTLVFFISDNGGPTRELTSSNAPLRGGKGQVYEGGLRVPFLARWPGVLPAGAVYRQPVWTPDVLATALAAAGVEPPRGRILDGVDLVPFLTDERNGPPHAELYWRLDHRTALRSGNWKLVRNARRGQGRGAEAAAPAWQLFDLENDLAESRDLAAERPGKLRELTEAWERWNGQMKEPFWRRPPGR